MVPVQGGPFSDGLEAQAFMSLHLFLGRQEFVACQVFGQPCCAGICRGFYVYQEYESQSGLLRNRSLYFYLGLLYSG